MIGHKAKMRAQETGWAHSGFKIYGIVIEFYKELKNVSCEYDRWVLASCAVRQTRSFGSLIMYFICNMVFVN